MINTVFLSILFLSASALAASPNCNLQKSRNQIITDLKGIVSSKKINLCEPLKLGESRNFNVADELSPTKVEHSYEMQRTGKNEFQATFNLHFYEQSDPDETARNRGYTFVWRKKANECLASIGNKLSGPKGEILKLKLDENPKINQLPRSEVILKSDDSSNSHEWEKNLDCPSILHELLHLMGLVDEYQERASGYSKDPVSGRMVWKKKEAEKPGYDCRTLAKDSSIMADQNAHWNKVFSKATLNRKIQFCECNDRPTCDKYFHRNDSIQKEFHELSALWQANEKLGISNDALEEKAKSVEAHYNSVLAEPLPKVCPEGFQVNDQLTEDIPVEEDRKDYSYFRTKPFPSGITEDQILNLVVTSNITPLIEKDSPSLLNTTQWNALMFPGCFAKNWEYYMNAQNAYRTSKENGGRGCYKFLFMENAVDPGRLER